MGAFLRSESPPSILRVRRNAIVGDAFRPEEVVARERIRAEPARRGVVNLRGEERVL